MTPDMGEKYARCKEVKRSQERGVFTQWPPDCLKQSGQDSAVVGRANR